MRGSPLFPTACRQPTQQQTQGNSQPCRGAVCLLKGDVNFHRLLRSADLDAAGEGDDLAALGEGDVEGDGGRLCGELLGDDAVGDFLEGCVGGADR